jgi:hypothetical protein
MKNKILLILLFLLSFIILININNKVGAFNFECNNIIYDTDNYNIVLKNYNFVEYDNDYVRLYSCDNDIISTPDLKNISVDPKTAPLVLSIFVFKYSDGSFVESHIDLSYEANTIFAFPTSKETIIYNDFDIKDNKDNIVLPKNVYNIELNLSVTPDTDTKNVPVKISTDFYSLKVFEDILVQYSTNQNDWTTCSWGLFNDGSGSANKYNFYLDVYRNGTYYFRLWNAADNTYIYKTVVISNIVYSPDDVNNYVNGVFDPTPFLTYEYINDSKINIITQKFFIDQIIDLQCFYAKDISKEDYNNKEKWTKVEARTMIDQLTQRDVYQFCFEVDNNSFNADGTYTVCFYNVFLDKYTYSEIVINFDEILKVDGSMIWRYVHFFKERFGFLIYPFDLTINTLKRIASIDYGEPKFNIPDIYEPTTNQKLISAVEFNFNDCLENNTFKTVHNIYFIIVDAAIIFALLNLAWKKISGVFK